MAVNPSLSAFKLHIQRALSAAGETKFGTAGGKLGFFGKAPVVRPSALTAANNGAVGATYTAAEQAVITNIRTRLNELETAQKNLGLLP